MKNCMSNNSGTGNRTPSCREHSHEMRGGNVSRYTIPDIVLPPSRAPTTGRNDCRGCDGCDGASNTTKYGNSSAKARSLNIPTMRVQYPYCSDFITTYTSTAYIHI